jgi:hypothetical protein
VRSLRPKVGKAVLHVSLSAAAGEHLSDDQWRQVAAHYLQGMGLENNQYIVTRHLDTEHEHVHLLVNRIRFDGGITSDSHDYRRQEVLMRAIEREYDLQRVQPSIECSATRRPRARSKKDCVPASHPRQRLQQLCDAAAKDCNFSDYAARLDAVDVQLVPVLQLEERKLSGLSYVLDGVMMKGSDLGRATARWGWRNEEWAMTKSETLKQLAAASNEARLASLNQQIERLREAKLTSAEELATLIEPLAQAMAALTDETRASLEHVQEYNQEQSNQFFKQLENMTTAWHSAAMAAQQAAHRLRQQEKTGGQSLPPGRRDQGSSRGCS